MLVQDTIAFDVFFVFLFGAGGVVVCFSLTYEQMSQGFKFMEEDTCEGPQDYVEGFPLRFWGRCWSKTVKTQGLEGFRSRGFRGSGCWGFGDLGSLRD